MKRCIILFLLFGLNYNTFAQDSLQKYNQFSFNYENDFFQATDRYYSQGVWLSLYAPFIRFSPLSKTLLKFKTADNFYNVSVRQDCYTPKSIRYDTLNRLERPYAGAVYLTHGNTSVIGQTRLNSSLDLGLIGPYAKCEETQKGIHKALDNIQPLGWEYQLSTAPIVNFNAALEHQMVSSRLFQLISQVGFRAGSMFSDASVGIQIKLGKMQNNFLPLFYSSRMPFRIYLHANATVRAVGYNAMLQGGLFTDNAHTIAASDIKRFVFTSDVSLNVSYKQVLLQYARTYISPEFKRGVEHGWGRCIIAYSF